MTEWLTAPVTNATIIYVICLYSLYQIYLRFVALNEEMEIIALLEKENGYEQARKDAEKIINDIIDDAKRK